MQPIFDGSRLWKNDPYRWICLVLAAIVFGLDIHFAAAVSGLAYVLILFITWWSSHRSTVVIVAISCSFLILLTRILVPFGSQVSSQIVQCGLALLAVWIVSCSILYRRRTVDQLESAQEMYHSLVEHLPQNIFCKDWRGRIVFANRHFCDFLRKPLQAVLGTTAHELHAPKIAQQYIEDDLWVMETGRAMDTVKEYERLDGARGFTHVIKTPRFDREGRIGGIQCIFWDITESRQAAELQKSRSRVLELLATGKSLEEILSVLITTTERACFGLTASVLLMSKDGQCLCNGVAPNLPNFFSEAIDGLVIGPRAGSCGTCAYTRKRVIVEDVLKSPLWEDYRELVQRAGLRSCWSEPIWASTGKALLGTLAMYYKQPRRPSPSELAITRNTAHLAGIAIEHRYSQRALMEAREQLAERVRERTVELEVANERLQGEISVRRQAEDLLREKATDLKRSNQELEQFAYVASHDLQEPLRAVAGHCRLLQRRYKGRLGQEADEFLMHAVEGAKRMKALIDGLLAYSRVGVGSNENSSSDGEEVLDEVLENLSSVLQETGAEITHDCLPTVGVDRLGFVELLQNLIGNSVKYKSDRPPRIHVGVHLKDREHVFSVCDNGIGIAQEHWSRIFVVFQRLHTRDEFPGTGIGLAICRKIVDRWGGRIWVESELGQGTTVFFTIPKD